VMDDAQIVDVVIDFLLVALALIVATIYVGVKHDE
jgi:hypothetical protein